MLIFAKRFPLAFLVGFSNKTLLEEILEDIILEEVLVAKILDEVLEDIILKKWLQM